MMITWKFQAMLIWVIIIEIISTIHNKSQFKIDGFKDLGLQVKCIVSGIALIGF